MLMHPSPSSVRLRQGKGHGEESNLKYLLNTLMRLRQRMLMVGIYILPT